MIETNKLDSLNSKINEKHKSHGQNKKIEVSNVISYKYQ